MRGRILGIELVQVAGAPTLGNLEAGVVAALTSIRTSIVWAGFSASPEPQSPAWPSPNSFATTRASRSVDSERLAVAAEPRPAPADTDLLDRRSAPVAWFSDAPVDLEGVLHPALAPL